MACNRRPFAKFRPLDAPCCGSAMLTSNVSLFQIAIVIVLKRFA